jgi:hypothetical protein
MYFGYATMEKSRFEESVRLRVPGKREEIVLKIHEIDRMLVEDQEYVVMKLEAPKAMVKEGSGKVVTSMVKRVGLQNDFIQVFEYKYGLKNPKSPIKTMHTTWFVGFMNKNPSEVLSELGSPGFREKWSIFLENQPKLNGLANHFPGSVKQINEIIKNLENLQTSESNLSIAD